MLKPCVPALPAVAPADALWYSGGMNSSIPRWNLDSIYHDITSDEYRQALESFSSAMEENEALLETASRFTREANANFDFPAWLSSYLAASDALVARCRTLAAYAYVTYSTDTTDTAHLNNLTRVQELSVRMQQQELKFSTMLLAHRASLDEFYRRFPQYGQWRYLLDEVLEGTRHQMPAAEEKLAMDMQRTGGDAWGRLQEQLVSTLHDDGGRMFNEIRNDAFSADAALRKASWQKELALLSRHRVAFAAALNNLKGETVLLNRRRHWADALERALVSSRMGRSTLDSLIAALEGALPMWRSYFQAKARLLRRTGCTASATAGTGAEPGLAFYDLFAPLPGGGADSLLEKRWTFAEARDYVVAEYKSFSPDMGAFAEKAFAEGWIDAEIRPGKVGGAYDEDFPKGHQSRILLNFTGTFSDIITLAHELGHAYHFSCMKGKPATFFDYPMTLAETASTFAETITKQDVLARCGASDKLRLLDIDLQDAAQVLVDILCRFYFESSVFEERQNGELSADDFCRLMRSAQERSYGSGLNSERHEYMWAVKSHYYSTGLDFYNFPYAFGQLFAAALYMKSRQEGPSFAATYAALLADTGSMSCEDLCRKAGFDISTKEFWDGGIAMYAAEIAEFTALAEKV